MSILPIFERYSREFFERRFFQMFLAVTAIFLGGPISARAAIVIAGPTSGQFNVAGLPDGNYRFCSDVLGEGLRLPNDVPRVSGACFRFRKNAGSITGDFYYPYIGDSICLNGRVNGNTVSGQAVERLPEGVNSATGVGPDQPLSDWRESGFLQVGRGVYVDDLNRRDAIRYRSALLNLNNFYQYNAGAVLPPTECPTRPSSFIGATPNPDTLIEVGTSEFYQKPVYLDSSSIRPVTEGTYRYTTIIGVPERLSESDYQLTCRNLETVQVLRSRYYDSDGDLQELEIVNQSVPITPGNPAGQQRDSASQYVCNEYAQQTLGTPLPAEVNYQRYRNDRFNYSVLYPEQVLIPQGESDSQDGQVFYSESEEVVLRVYADNNAPRETLAERYQQAQAGRSVTYQTIEDDDFFVVSGNDEGDVFYQKTIFEEGIFKTLELRYPQALRRDFDAIARTIADSFATTEVGTGITELPTEVQSAVLVLAAEDTEAPSAIFEVISAEQHIWPDGCLGLAKAEEVCTQAQVSGWRVQVEAELAGAVRTLTYRTDETGRQVRFEPAAMPGQ